MAKLKRLFTGTDTYGRQVQRAESESGKFFARSFEFNGFGKSWCKWYETDADFFESEIEVEIQQGIFANRKLETPVAFWGWNRMNEHKDDLPAYRLPA